MKQLIEIVVGFAAFVALAWLYLKGLELHERMFGHPPRVNSDAMAETA